VNHYTTYSVINKSEFSPFEAKFCAKDALLMDF